MDMMKELLLKDLLVNNPFPTEVIWFEKAKVSIYY